MFSIVFPTVQLRGYLSGHHGSGHPYLPPRLPSWHLCSCALQIVHSPMSPMSTRSIPSSQRWVSSQHRLSTVLQGLPPVGVFASSFLAGSGSKAVLFDCKEFRFCISNKQTFRLSSYYVQKGQIPRTSWSFILAQNSCLPFDWDFLFQALRGWKSHPVPKEPHTPRCVSHYNRLHVRATIFNTGSTGFR